MENPETPQENLNEEELREQVEEIFTECIKRPEVAEALKLLDDLPESLEYHNKEHTLDVIQETILFVLASGETREVLEQQIVAAAWHDVGYIEQYDKNEPIAVELFEKSKAYGALSEERRKEVVANILDTQLKEKDGEPVIEQDRSSYGYLLDADTSNFGRDDFFEKREKVARELGIDLDDTETRKRFLTFALKLLENHSWKTEAAAKLRQDKKVENIVRVKDEMAKL